MQGILNLELEILYPSKNAMQISLEKKEFYILQKTTLKVR